MEKVHMFCSLTKSRNTKHAVIRNLLQNEVELRQTVAASSLFFL